MLVRNGVARSIPIARVGPSLVGSGSGCVNTLPNAMVAGSRYYSNKQKIEKKVKADVAPVVVSKYRDSRAGDHPVLLQTAVPLPLPDFSPNLLNPDSVGSAVFFPNERPNTVPHGVFGVPKNVQKEFDLSLKPFTVIRDTTMKLLETIDAAAAGPSDQSRHVLTGPTGCGKSHLLLQGVTYCALSNWIVLYVPRSIPLVNSSTPYVYDPRTRTYLQNPASADLLRKFQTLNSQKLRQIQTTRDFKSPLPENPDSRTPPPAQAEAGIDLDYVVSLGVRDQSIASFVLEWVMEELGRQEKFPVLVAVDDFQALYRTSFYRDPQFLPIKAHHLSLPRLLLEYASGRRSFSRGMALGALSTTHTSFLPPVELLEGIDSSTPSTSATRSEPRVSAYGSSPASPASLLPRPVAPLAKRSKDLQVFAQGLKNFEMPYGMTMQEAMQLFTVWMNEKALHTTPSDQFFLTKYSETSGNPREFVWKGLMETLDT